jgi:hypothetical protein
MTGLDPVEPPEFPWTTLVRKTGRAQPGDEDEPKPRVRAVEMPRRGKGGKLPERVFHCSHRAWQSRKKRGIPTFPPPRLRRAYGLKYS